MKTKEEIQLEIDACDRQIKRHEERITKARKTYNERLLENAYAAKELWEFVKQKLEWVLS